MDAINWHSFFFLLFAVDRLRVRRGGGGDRQHRAHGLLTWSCRWPPWPGLFFLAGADFLGAVQLMVYVGGTMVLLVFGVMLTARGPFVSMKTGGGQWIMATIVGGALAGRAAAGGAERARLVRCQDGSSRSTGRRSVAHRRRRWAWA